MLIVILVIGLGVLGLGIWLGIKDDWYEEIYITPMVAGGIITICVLISSIIGMNALASQKALRAEIQMYEVENQNIEDEVALIVKSYVEYEEGVFGNINVENYAGDKMLLLTQLYPELKANTLIQSQIEIHNENTKEIKELKSQLIKSNVWKWWLYFGSPDVVEI